MPRVATIATMPSRIETFRMVLPVIHAQVDHVYIFLDGYGASPDFLAGFDRVTVRRAEEEGDLHSSGRWLCVQELTAPTVVLCVDDDIVYPTNYVDGLTNALQRFEGKAIVGVHGQIFLPPHESYVRNSSMFHFAQGLQRDMPVHEVGSGTCCFISSIFNVDPKEWRVESGDDINAAIEAQRRGLPRIAVARPPGWLRPYAECQPDSLWAKTLIDDSEQSRQMRSLMSLIQTSGSTIADVAIPRRNEPCPCGSGRRYKHCHGKYL